MSNRMYERMRVPYWAGRVRAYRTVPSMPAFDADAVEGSLVAVPDARKLLAGKGRLLRGRKLSAALAVAAVVYIVVPTVALIVTTHGAAPAPQSRIGERAGRQPDTDLAPGRPAHSSVYFDRRVECHKAADEEGCLGLPTDVDVSAQEFTERCGPFEDGSSRCDPP